MREIVLLGDSILDNAAYVGRGEAVIDYLREELPQSWRPVLLAQDGAIVDDVAAQLRRLPTGTAHVVISAGGNDALGYFGLLSEPARSMAAALDRLAEVQEEFEARYQRMIHLVAKLRVPVTLCTIYNGRLQDPVVQRLARTALIVFNDVILRAAAAHEMQTIELRQVCSERADYANDIEPSGRGARKIAQAIGRRVRQVENQGPAFAHPGTNSLEES